LDFLWYKIMKNVIVDTRKYFSFAWTKFARKEVERQWYKDSFSYLKFIPEEIFKDEEKLGLDLGCGSGSDMINIARYGARIVGIDISDAIKATRENISGFGRLHVAQANIYNLPFRDETFDFAYSFGVLHHLPDPEKGFRILCSKVKKDGYAIIYVYEDFSKRSVLERILLNTINFLRLITPKIPPPLLYLLCIAMSPFVLLFCSAPYRILKRIKWTKTLAEKIPFRHTTRLDCIVADLYDRFSPPIERRYSKDQVTAWFRSAGFEDVHITNHRGWVAWGRKR
ncbi:MAG: methyltransferase domain-containing protein, partial [Candidatus Omnitrophota bacterium]|nr:methyltransferase domain-containing protein [Candidatus Omnitrophota bacterium]